MELRLPENWTSSKGDDVAGVGLGAGVRVIGVTTVESGKVSIDVTIRERSPVGVTIVPLSAVRCR